jgi:hypothetical protein
MARRNRRIGKNDARTGVHSSRSDLYSKLRRSHMRDRETTIGISRLPGHSGRWSSVLKKWRKEEEGMKGLNVINCTYFSIKVTLHRFNNTYFQYYGCRRVWTLGHEAQREASHLSSGGTCVLPPSLLKRSFMSGCCCPTDRSAGLGVTSSMHTTYTGEIKHTKTGISTCLRLSADIPNLEILSRHQPPHTCFLLAFLVYCFSRCTTLVYLGINK